MIFIRNKRDFGYPWIAAGNLSHYSGIIHHDLARLNASLVAFVEHDLAVKGVAWNVQDFSHYCFALHSLRRVEKLAQVGVFSFHRLQSLEPLLVEESLLSELCIFPGQVVADKEFAYVVINRYGNISELLERVDHRR